MKKIHMICGYLTLGVGSLLANMDINSWVPNPEKPCNEEEYSWPGDVQKTETEVEPCSTEVQKTEVESEEEKYVQVPLFTTDVQTETPPEAPVAPQDESPVMAATPAPAMIPLCTGKDSCYENVPFVISGEFLYWTAENQGNTFAYLQHDPITAAGVLRSLPSSWSPGFRLGFGWNTPSDHWDVLLNWTWFYHKVHKTYVTEITQAFQGFWPLWVSASGTDFGPYGVASANWRLHNNDIDFEMGRLIHLTQTFDLRPHMGVRAALVYQQLHNYFSSIFPANNTPLPYVEIDRTSNYWGIGPRGGLDGVWNLGKGFGILGKVSGSLLYGQSKMRMTPATIHPAEYNDQNIHIMRDFVQSFNALVPTVQWSLGFQWEKCIYDDLFININLAWEANYLWIQSGFPVVLDGRTAPIPSSGNQPVSMEGLTFGIELDF